MGKSGTTYEDMMRQVDRECDQHAAQLNASNQPILTTHKQTCDGGCGRKAIDLVKECRGGCRDVVCGPCSLTWLDSHDICISCGPEGEMWSRFETHRVALRKQRELSAPTRPSPEKVATVVDKTDSSKDRDGDAVAADIWYRRIVNEVKAVPRPTLPQCWVFQQAFQKWPSLTVDVARALSAKLDVKKYAAVFTDESDHDHGRQFYGLSVTSHPRAAALSARLVREGIHHLYIP